MPTANVRRHLCRADQSSAVTPSAEHTVVHVTARLALRFEVPVQFFQLPLQPPEDDCAIVRQRHGDCG